MPAIANQYFYYYFSFLLKNYFFALQFLIQTVILNNCFNKTWFNKSSAKLVKPKHLYNQFNSNEYSVFNFFFLFITSKRLKAQTSFRVHIPKCGFVFSIAFLSHFALRRISMTAIAQMVADTNLWFWHFVDCFMPRRAVLCCAHF